MTPLERQSVKNYFWTAQLIVGPTTAIKMFEPSLEGVGAAIAGFLFVAPIAALIAWVYVVMSRARSQPHIEPPERSE